MKKITKNEKDKFLKDLWGLKYSIQNKQSKIIFYANFVFAEDLLNDIDYYMEEYGIDIIIKFISIDLNRLNTDIYHKSMDDYNLLSEMWFDTMEFIKKDISVVLSSIKRGESFHTNEDFKYILRHYPELLV